MKKTLLSICSTLLVLIGYNQTNTNIIPKANIDIALKKAKKADGSELINGPIKVNHSRGGTVSETVIGTTVYDLQTNGTSQRRIFTHKDSSISAVWTMDNGASPYFNRGAGYNFKSGTSWGANPTSKVESTRNGWPALTAQINGDNEFIISHSGSGGLTLNKRSTKGTGAWSESVIATIAPTGFDVLWPRAVVGGAKDSTLHVLASIRASSTGGPQYKGLTTALVYYRSQDLGVTWDIQDSILPGLDSSKFTFVASDSYSIDAKGDTIAFASYNSWGDVLVYKSIDNGNTWTSTRINDFPINKYSVDDGSDVDSDGNFDTIPTCDNSGSLMIDKMGVVHVFYGLTRVLDDNLTDETSNYFPGTNGLAYWNESFGADSTQTITGALDLDGSGSLDVVPTGGSFPSYQVGMSSMPSCGVSDNNTLYLVYSAMAESHNSGVQTYRHLYVIKSTDGGTSWSSPEDYTPDFSYDSYEAVYPSMAKRVDDRIHIVYQRDFEPGNSIAGDEDPAGNNDIVYLDVDTAMTPLYASLQETSNEFSIHVYPNPANDFVNVKLATKNNFSDNLSISIVDALGRTVRSIGEKFNGKSATLTMDVSSLKNGIYFLRIVSTAGIVTKTFVKK